MERFIPRSGSLVSSIYRLAPSEAMPSEQEAQRRVESRLQRLIAQFGGAEVRRRIREAEGDDSLKARLVLLALTADAFE